jgi:hypothetical protein
MQTDYKVRMFTEFCRRNLVEDATTTENMMEVYSNGNVFKL